VDRHETDLVGINDITRVLLVYTCQQGVYPRGHVLPLRLPLLSYSSINSKPDQSRAPDHRKLAFSGKKKIVLVSLQYFLTMSEPDGESQRPRLLGHVQLETKIESSNLSRNMDDINFSCVLGSLIGPFLI
jgi:hypothetical protein